MVHAITAIHLKNHSVANACVVHALATCVVHARALPTSLAALQMVLASISLSPAAAVLAAVALWTSVALWPSEA